MTTIASPLAKTTVAAPRKPRSSDLMRVIAEIESTFPVDAWSVDGIELWPLLRIRWFFAEWARLYPGGAATSSPSPGGRMRAFLHGAGEASRARRNDAAGNDSPTARRDVVFLSDGLSFARLGESWVERFCDPLIRAAKRHGATSALWTPGHAYHVPRLTPSVFVQAAIDRANVSGVVHSRFAAGAAKRLPERARVCEHVRSRGFADAAFSPSAIASDACRLRTVSAEFGRRLDATRPRLAFVVSYYSLEAMAFVHACRLRGIPVVDIQHGVQGEFHPGYAALPSGAAHALLPDRFWVWSEWERSIIDKWASGSGHAAVIGGNPWLDLWRGDAEWPGTREAIAAGARLREHAGSRPVVLVTLQFGLSDEHLEPLRRLIARAGDRLSFWPRLHPLMMVRREEIRAALAGAGAVELDAASDLPLHALLPLCDVHMTHSSSTVIEAAQCAVPSLITSDYGAEFFTTIVESGGAVVETGDTAAVEAAIFRLLRGRARLPFTPSQTDATMASLLAATSRDSDRRAA